MRGEGIVSHHRPHTWGLIRSHRHTGASATHQDRPLETPGRHRFSHGMGDIWIVHRLRAVTAEIMVFIPEFGESIKECPFQGEPGLVASDRDDHYQCSFLTNTLRAPIINHARPAHRH